MENGVKEFLDALIVSMGKPYRSTMGSGEVQIKEL